jgi:hypothetical protein
LDLKLLSIFLISFEREAMGFLPHEQRLEISHVVVLAALRLGSG